MKDTPWSVPWPSVQPPLLSRRRLQEAKGNIGLPLIFVPLAACPRINCCSDYRQSKLEYLLISAARELIMVSPVLMWPVSLWAGISRTGW